MMMICVGVTGNGGAVVVDALSSSSSSSASATSTPGPWDPASWTIQLSLGRSQSKKSNENQRHPYGDANWGMSGGRLVVSVDVQVTAASVLEKSADLSKKHQQQQLQQQFPTESSVFDASLYPQRQEGHASQNKWNQLQVEASSTQSTYVTMQGEQTVRWKSFGGWALHFPPSGPQHKGCASLIDLYIDTSVDMERNDITIAAGERLYLSIPAWREDALQEGINRLRPITASYHEAEQKLQSQLSHETGDRRLDGDGKPLDTLQAYGDMTQLVYQRNQCRQEYKKARKRYPTLLDSDDGSSVDLPEGPWPGAVEWLSLAQQGDIYILSSSQHPQKNPSLSFLPASPKSVFCQVGTWQAAPNLDGVDYEEV